jgi:hypothetical protein
MKNLKTVLGIVALVFISGAVLATGNLKVNIIPGENEEAVVHIKNATHSMYEVELKNDEGNVVFYKETKTPSKLYSQAYNFSMVEDGEYFMQVKVGSEKEVFTLNISNGKVEVLDQRKVVEPFFTMQGKKLELSYLNFAQEDLRLLVYNNYTRELLYEKELEPGFAVHFALDFSKLRSGRYDAILAGENEFYEYEVAIK